MGGAFFRIEKPHRVIVPKDGAISTAGALQNVDHLWTVDGARRTTSAPRRLTCWLGSSWKARTVHPLKTCAVVCLLYGMGIGDCMENLTLSVLPEFNYITCLHCI